MHRLPLYEWTVLPRPRSGCLQHKRDGYDSIAIMDQEAHAKMVELELWWLREATVWIQSEVQRHRTKRRSISISISISVSIFTSISASISVCVFIYRDWFILRNWLMWLWRLSPVTAGWRPRRASGRVAVWVEKTDVLAQVMQREWIHPFSFVFSWGSQRGGQCPSSAVFSPLPTESDADLFRNTLTDKSRKVLPTIPTSFYPNQVDTLKEPP